MVLDVRAPFQGDYIRAAFEVDGICILGSVYAVDDACVDVWLDADVELDEARCAAAYDCIRLYLQFERWMVGTPFEAACWVILTRRLALAHAQKIKDRIHARWGSSIVREGVRYRAFPSAGRLANARDEDLRAAGVPSATLRYLRSAIDAFAARDERLHGENALTAVRLAQAPNPPPFAYEREIHRAGARRRDSRREVPR